MRLLPVRSTSDEALPVPKKRKRGLVSCHKCLIQAILYAFNEGVYERVRARERARARGGGGGGRGGGAVRERGRGREN